MTAIPEPDTLAILDLSQASAKDIGIAILIDLAQRGEIDPWDVQVIDVIDRYLSQLALTTDTEAGRRDTDLSESGQAFLWASMLVLLKADTLGRLDAPPEDDFIDLEAEGEDNSGLRLPPNLERHLRRRPTAQPLQRRPVTLQELIEQLQQMAASLEEKPLTARHRRPKAQSRAQAARAIAQLAHDENLTETAGKLDQFLTRHCSQFAQGQDWLDLEELLELWSRASAVEPALLTPDAEPQARSHDRVGVFWALLLLSAQSKVELSQEEFYQEIKIRSLSPNDLTTL
jgi:segregation and condensation protein A